MIPSCPSCSLPTISASGFQSVVRFGSYYRTSDSRRVQRFQCLVCKRGFSSATLSPSFRQKKRHKNFPIARLLAAEVSQREIARIHHVNRTTVARKLIYMAEVCRTKLMIENHELPRASEIEFDDLDTFEHTKCKPLSVTLAVEYPTRRILGFRVSQMAAKGHLSKIALKKYGRRKDTRTEERRRLFQDLKPLVLKNAVIKSDSNPHYVDDVKFYFPNCFHKRFLGQRGAITGQGELKKVKFDPLFRLNHTCAMFRAHVCRLIRKTWCTTKRAERLSDHLAIYAYFHNRKLSLSQRCN